MDEARWRREQVIQNSSTIGSKGGAVAEISRYHHDMEQAFAMQSNNLNQRREHKTNTTTQQPQLLSPEDVRLALNGLDQARQYKLNRNYESALKLYELSLELLIKVLGVTDDTIILSSNLNRQQIQTRVKEALSDAENIKIQLQRQGTIDLTKDMIPPTSSWSSTTSSSSTIFSALQAAVQKVNTKSTNNNNKQQPIKSPAIVRHAAVSGTNKTQIRQQSQQNKPHTQMSVVPSTTVVDEVSQSILRDFYVDPNTMEKISWDDIAGLANVKQALQETAILPLVRPDLFTGLRKPRNILLYGPPGTGKTLLAKAVAHESQSNLFVVTASSITSKWMGEAEKLVKCLFKVAHEMAPSIIFMDEMDALLSARKSDGEHEASRRLKTEFMIQIDGIIPKETINTKNVLLMACTNCPWDVDSAVIRRFPKRIYVPLPDADGRKVLLQILLDKKMGNHSIKSKRQIDSIVRRMDGFSCSDITAMASEAAFGPIRSLSASALRSAKKQDIRPVDISDFDNAIQIVTKSISTEQLKKYDDWHKQQQATM